MKTALESTNTLAGVKKTVAFLHRYSWMFLAAFVLLHLGYVLYRNANTPYRPQQARLLEDAGLRKLEAEGWLKLTLPVEYRPDSYRFNVTQYPGRILDSGHLLIFKDAKRGYRMSLVIRNLHWDPLLTPLAIRALSCLVFYFFCLYILSVALQNHERQQPLFNASEIPYARFFGWYAILLPFMLQLHTECLSGCLSLIMLEGSLSFANERSSWFLFLLLSGFIVLHILGEQKKEGSQNGLIACPREV